MTTASRTRRGSPGACVFLLLLHGRDDCLWLHCEISCDCFEQVASCCWPLVLPRAAWLRRRRRTPASIATPLARSPLEVTAETVQPGHPRAEGPHLRQLPWWRSHSDDPDSHEPQGRMERQDRSQADSRSCAEPAIPMRPTCGSTIPSLRTDQLSQYHTSVHGKLLREGRYKVAVCTDCHSVHDLRPPSDPRSTVHPAQRGQDLLALPRRRGVHEGVLHSHRPVRKVQHQRAP